MKTVSGPDYAFSGQDTPVKIVSPKKGVLRESEEA
jgi:hypothetical protein